MATKLKKRNPAAVFIIFFLSLSLLLATVAVGLGTVLVVGTDSIGLDYKDTRAYRNQLIGGYLIEGMYSALNPEHLNTMSDLPAVQDRFSQEGANLSWMICDVNGNILMGNTDTQTPEQFIEYYTEELDTSYQNYNSSSIIPSFIGYDHLVVMKDGKIEESYNSRIGQSSATIPLAQSEYVSWFPTDMREQLMRLPEESWPTVCFAVKAEGSLANNTGFIYNSYFDWFMVSRCLLVLAGVAAVSLLGLILVGIKHKSLALANSKIAQWSGWVPLECKVVALIGGIGFVFVGLDAIGWDEFGGGMFCLMSFWVFYLLLNDLRYNKKRVFLHNIPLLLVRFLKSLESKYPFCARMKHRLVLLICVEAALLVLFSLLIAGFSGYGFLFGIPLIGLGGFLLIHYVFGYNRQVGELTQVIDYAEQVRTGTAIQPLVLPAGSDFSDMADTLNDIHSGMVRMVDARVKSDQMKAELITNVSHDLKTPLTSIINYIDLLSREQLSPEFANEYVKVLAGKSERLKNLVQDLFEISKAQSGAIDFTPEKLNIVALLEQTVAEMDARSQTGNEIRLQFSEPHLVVCADGKKLHRVFENLLGNALKYAMQGTRVYVTMQSSGQYVQIVFKNIAGYEMNFTEQEIVERFQRGDASRTSDGSGLGLAIAKSFLELNGGTLRVELDGDMFKAIVTIPVYQPEQERAVGSQPDIAQNATHDATLTPAIIAAREACRQEPSSEEGQTHTAPPALQMDTGMMPVLSSQTLTEAAAREHGNPSPMETETPIVAEVKAPELQVEVAAKTPETPVEAEAEMLEPKLPGELPEQDQPYQIAHAEPLLPVMPKPEQDIAK